MGEDADQHHRAETRRRACVCERGLMYQAREHAAYHAAAPAAFVRAVVAHLPAPARDELHASPDVGGWAQRWHIACPCVLDWAQGEIICQRIIGPGGHLVALRGGVDVPEDWWAILHDLNATTLDAGGRDP